MGGGGGSVQSRRNKNGGVRELVQQLKGQSKTRTFGKNQEGETDCRVRGQRDGGGFVTEKAPGPESCYS